MQIKTILALIAAAFIAPTAFSQCTGLSIEAAAELDGVVGTTDLTGYTVYHVYADMENDDDRLVSLFGLTGEESNMSITSTGDIFQSPFGGVLSSNVSEQLTKTQGFEDLRFDSFLTINKMTDADAGIVMGAQTIPTDAVFDNEGFFINDGAVFATPDAVNCTPVEGKVLIAQITTNGLPTLTTGVMTFVNGDRNQEVREQFTVTAKSEVEEGLASSGGVSFDVYPNPTNAMVTIAYTPQSDKCNYQIHDNSGRLVEQWSNQNGMQQKDLSGLSAGMYHITITDGSQVLKQSVQVTR